MGFGGSVGLEGPTVATGAALGSSIGQLFRFNYKQVVLLLGCACAGAMSAIFKAPIAGIVFALEVIMLDLTVASIIPLLMASASAALTSYLFMGDEFLYHFELTDKFTLSDSPYFIGLGILAGLVSLYFTRMYMSIGGLFEKIKKWQYRLLIGGATLGVLIFILPSLYGEGYEVVNLCLKGDYNHLFSNTLYHDYKDNIIAVIILFLAIVLFKVIATSITFGSGGIGGIFAPTLFMGANTGLFFAKGFNYLGIDINPSNFALAGMAGTIAGVLHTPLTAIFLIAEITGGYGLFLPLMITATISYATIKLFETNSVYTIQLAKRGELMTHDKDKAVLKRMCVEKLIESNFNIVNVDATLGELVKVISESERNIFPVLDEEGNLLGIVFLNEIRNIIFKPEMYENTFVRDLMFMPDTFVSPKEEMEDVAQKFHLTGHYNLPVLDNGKYLGFVSRAKVFSSYRKLLKYFSDD